LIEEGMDSNVAPAVRRETDDGFKVATRAVLQDPYGDSTLDNKSEQGSLSEDPQSLPDPLGSNIQSPNKGSVSSASQRGSKVEWPPPPQSNDADTPPPKQPSRSVSSKRSSFSAQKALPLRTKSEPPLEKQKVRASTGLGHYKKAVSTFSPTRKTQPGDFVMPSNNGEKPEKEKTLAVQSSSDSQSPGNRPIGLKVQ
jgi:hypothetical protein